jgi:hypothetical protein
MLSVAKHPGTGSEILRFAQDAKWEYSDKWGDKHSKSTSKLDDFTRLYNSCVTLIHELYL